MATFKSNKKANQIIKVGYKEKCGGKVKYATLQSKY